MKIILILLLIVIVLLYINNKKKHEQFMAEPGLPDCSLYESKVDCNSVNECSWFEETGYKPQCQLKILPDKYKMLYNCIIQPTEWACKGLPACTWYEEDLKRVCVLKELPNK
jgi:hypothetical protein